jgi:hypothetical protein
LLAGLPLLAHRFLGPAGGDRLGWFLRAGVYAAVLALIVAKASVSRVASAPAAGTPAREFDWFGQIAFLVVMTGYVVGILAVTARRSRIAPATLAIGTGTGIALGVVMYAVAPLGLSKHATEPWLAGSAIDPVVTLAWILLLGGPALGGAVAGLRCRGQGTPEQSARATIAQCGAAGFLATGVGAVIVTVLGTGTIALLSQAAWLQHWLYPGQHLVPAVAYSHELAASSSVGGYGLILLAFPAIGLLLGLYSATVPMSRPGRAPGGGIAPEEAGPALPEPTFTGYRPAAAINPRLTLAGNTHDANPRACHNGRAGAVIYRTAYLAPAARGGDPGSGSASGPGFCLWPEGPAGRGRAGSGADGRTCRFSPRLYGPPVGVLTIEPGSARGGVARGPRRVYPTRE